MHIYITYIIVHIHTYIYIYIYLIYHIYINYIHPSIHLYYDKLCPILLQYYNVCVCVYCCHMHIYGMYMRYGICTKSCNVHIFFKNSKYRTTVTLNMSMQDSLFMPCVGTLAMVFSTVQQIFILNKARYALKDFKHPVCTVFFVVNKKQT